MADLSVNFAGIRSPNPFWLASGPPTNSSYQVSRAFEQGWGGAVWKTVGAPVMNPVNRYGAIDYNGQKLSGLNNIELISDRTPEANLREIARTKKLFPDRALIVSLMVESTREAWHTIVGRTIDAGADGIELNFGCPHGMNERGMGSAVGQVPEYCTMITGWVKEVSTIPVIVKLTPNVTDILAPARAARAGGADAISLINTVNSIMGVDLDTFEIAPSVDGKGTHGGLAGPAVKPIALHMVSQVTSDAGPGLPVSAIGGIATWRDAAEFLLLGAHTVQLCSAVMHHGFRIIEDLTEGLSHWMDEKGFRTIGDFRGRTLAGMTDFGSLNLLYRTVARIDEATCIRCNLCYIACEDGAHQSIDMVRSAETVQPRIREADCVGCALCFLVCPVEGCIRMVKEDGRGASVSWNDLMKELPQPVTWEMLRQFQRKHGIKIE